MPFTPFHWGPSSWIGLLGFRYLNLAAFLIASVIVDVEPFCVLVFNLNYPLHGFLHSFLGGTTVAIILSVILYRLRQPLNKIMNTIKLSQNSSFGIILLSCLSGVYFHVFLDAFLYTDIKPFYPTQMNPLYGWVSSQLMYLFCGASFLLGGLLYAVRLSKGKIKIVVKVLCSIAFTCFLIVMAGLFLLQWMRSPFDDGPFKGEPYIRKIEGTVDSAVKVGQRFILEVYNGIAEEPVLALRDREGNLIWSRLLTVSNTQHFENSIVDRLELKRSRSIPTGYHVQGVAYWTYGGEAANFYFNKYGPLEKFYLSW
jgi:hypothetical protein